MKILVAVKQVEVLDEDLEDLLEDRATSLDPEALEWELNEWDAYSLEAALQLREREQAGEVVVASVGGDEVDEGLLACLAKGADRAIRVEAPLDSDGSDPLDSDGSDPLDSDRSDPLATAQILAAVAQRESPDLILCGVQSSDIASAATGVALAGLLEIAHVAVVKAIALTGEALTVERELEGGAIEVLQIRPPALLTVQTGINEPRYATLRAIKQAREKPLQTLSLAELELTPADLQAARGAHVCGLHLPERLAGATMLDGPPEQIATRILEIVGEALAG